MAGWLLEEELRRKKNPQIQRKQAASELELERRSILNAMKYRDPERGGGGSDPRQSISLTNHLGLIFCKFDRSIVSKSDVIESVST